MGIDDHVSSLDWIWFKDFCVRQIALPWTGRVSEVVLLDITLHSGEAFSGFTYSPWFLDIPRKDVVFATNSSTIDKGEYWKLEATLRDLNEVIEKYGSVVDVKLFIAGCTDRVGDSSKSLRGRSKCHG